MPRYFLLEGPQRDAFVAERKRKAVNKQNEENRRIERRYVNAYPGDKASDKAVAKGVYKGNVYDYMADAFKDQESLNRSMNKASRENERRLSDGKKPLSSSELKVVQDKLRKRERQDKYS